MNPQIVKWNARYANHNPGVIEPPSSLLADAVAGLGAGRALDLACGAGRNAIWLARRGWRVDAVDGSGAALALVLANARTGGLPQTDRGARRRSRSRPAGSSQ